MKTGTADFRALDVDLPRAAWVAGFLLLAAIILRQLIPSRHNKAFLRLDGPANASWLLGGSPFLQLQPRCDDQGYFGD